jgi:hypothetical protein
MIRSKFRFAPAALLSVFVICAATDFPKASTFAAEKPAKTDNSPAEIARPQPNRAEGLKPPAAVENAFYRQIVNQIIGPFAVSNPAAPAQPKKSCVHVTAHNDRLTIRTILNEGTLETVSDRVAFEFAGLKGQITAAKNRVKFQFGSEGMEGDAEADRASYDNVEGEIELAGKVVFNRRSTNGATMSVSAESLYYRPTKVSLMFSGDTKPRLEKSDVHGNPLK